VIWSPNLCLPSGFLTKTLHAFITYPMHATCCANHFFLVSVLEIFDEEHKVWSFSLCYINQEPVTSPSLLLRSCVSVPPWNCGGWRPLCPSPRLCTGQYRAAMEWCWQGKTERPGAKKKPFQCHCVLHESHMDCPGPEPVPPRWEAGDKPPEPWHGLSPLLCLNIRCEPRAEVP
jgi:hypothetical protein